MYYPIITKRPSQKHLSISYKWVAEVNYEVYEATTTIVSYISSPCLQALKGSRLIALPIRAPKRYSRFNAHGWPYSELYGKNTVDCVFYFTTTERWCSECYMLVGTSCDLVFVQTAKNFTKLNDEFKGNIQF